MYECYICKKIIEVPRFYSTIKGKTIETLYECLDHKETDLNCLDNVSCKCGQTWKCAIYTGTEFSKLRLDY